MVRLINRLVNDCFSKAQPSIKFSMVTFMILGSLLANLAQAVEMTKEEYQLLPTYCRNQGNVAPNYFKPEHEAGWRDRLGKDFQHIHHYCWGLVSLARTYKAGRTAAERKHRLTTAIQDFNFSIDRATPEFVLLPEIYTKVGQAYLGLQDDQNAEIAFKKAWEANPEYWPAYLWWAQRLMKQGRQREALAVAEEGLKNSPSSKPLERLIAEMRGSGKGARK